MNSSIGIIDAMRILPQALLFDLDDTIVQFAAGADKAWDLVCAKYTDRLWTRGAARLKAEIDLSRTAYWSDLKRHQVGRLDMFAARRAIVEQACAGLDIKNTPVAHELADAFTRLREEWVKPFPGAIDTLRELRRRGVPMGMVTNGGSEFQRKKINRYDLAQYFEYILVEGEFGTGKPEPRVFQHVLDKLNVKAEHAWMVGNDLERDIRPALNLGIGTVWVDQREEVPQASQDVRPDRTVHFISELVDSPD